MTALFGNEIIVIDSDSDNEEVSCIESPSLVAKQLSSGTPAIIRVKQKQLYNLDGLTEDDFQLILWKITTYPHLLQFVIPLLLKTLPSKTSVNAHLVL